MRSNLLVLTAATVLLTIHPLLAMKPPEDMPESPTISTTQPPAAALEELAKNWPVYTGRDYRDRFFELKEKIEAIENTIAGEPSRLFRIILETQGFGYDAKEEAEIHNRLEAVRQARVQLLVENSEEYVQARHAFHEHLCMDPRREILENIKDFQCHAAIENLRANLDTVNDQAKEIAIARIKELDYQFSYVSKYGEWDIPLYIQLAYMRK